MLYRLRIFIPHFMLHVLDHLKDGTHRVLQRLLGPLFFFYDLFPVPLVYIAGMQIIQLLVPADGIHIRIQPFPRQESVITKRHTFPLSKRLYYLHIFVPDSGNVEPDRTLHSV